MILGFLEGGKFSQLIASGKKFYWFRKYFVLLSNKSLRKAFTTPFHLDRHKNFFIHLRGNSFHAIFHLALRQFSFISANIAFFFVFHLTHSANKGGESGDLLLNQARYSIVISFIEISIQPFASLLHSNVAEKATTLSPRRYHAS